MPIVPPTAKLYEDSLRLLPANSTAEPTELDMQIPAPSFVYKPIDAIRKGISELLPKMPGKRPAAPPPVPTAPGGGTPAGGTMAYSKVYFPRLGEAFYNWLKGKAERKGYLVKEVPYHPLQKEFDAGYPIQGCEKPGLYGHVINVMSEDKDGSIVSPWEKSKTLVHEYIGAEYFTRRGKSHMANESEIVRLSRELYPELACAA